MTKETCGCACHVAAGEDPNRAVDITDPIAASTCCSKCRPIHSAAFSSYLPPTHWTPQADGGEGAES